LSQLAFGSIAATIPEGATTQDVVSIVSNHIDLVKTIDFEADITVTPRLGDKEYYRCRLVENVEMGSYRFDLVLYDGPEHGRPVQYTVQFWDGRRQITWERTVTVKSSGAFPGDDECVPGEAVISSKRDISPRLAALFLNPLYQEKIVSSLRKESLRKEFHIGDYKSGLPFSIGSENIEVTIDPNNLRVTEMKFGTNAVNGKKYTMERVYFDKYEKSNDIDFPNFIKFVSNFGNGTRTEEVLVRRDSLKINGDVSSILERLVLPPGCMVSDQIQNRRYQIFNPEQIETAGKDLRRMLDKTIQESEEQKRQKGQ